MFPLHRLEVYLQAMQFARECAARAHCISDHALRSQLLRSARSIAANIAEGAGSGSQAVFARHIAIALGSAKEAECHIAMAVEAGELQDASRDQLLHLLNNLAPRLVRLMAAV